MRRSILLSLLVAAAAAISVLAPATPAGAIICPQASPPCCPVPTQGAHRAHIQPICCQPTTCCATGAATSQTCCVTGSTSPTCCPAGGCCNPPCVAGSLTIASSPNPSNAGGMVVISGGESGSSASGAQVVLWRESAGQSSFQKESQTTTDSAGRYKFTLGRGAVMADQAWYVTSSGLQSSTIQQRVNALVGLSASARSTRVGHAIRLSGRVTPSHAGEVVLIEASRGGAWRVIARAHLGRRSSYAVSEGFAQRGAVKLRVVLPGDKRNERSTSPTVTVTVQR